MGTAFIILLLGVCLCSMTLKKRQKRRSTSYAERSLTPLSRMADFEKSAPSHQDSYAESIFNRQPLSHDIPPSMQSQVELATPSSSVEREGQQERKQGQKENERRSPTPYTHPTIIQPEDLPSPPVPAALFELREQLRVSSTERSQSIHTGDELEEFEDGSGVSVRSVAASLATSTSKSNHVGRAVASFSASAWEIDPFHADDAKSLRKGNFHLAASPEVTLRLSGSDSTRYRSLTRS